MHAYNMCIYVYMYVHTHIYRHVYIYIYRERERCQTNGSLDCYHMPFMSNAFHTTFAALLRFIHFEQACRNTTAFPPRTPPSSPPSAASVRSLERLIMMIIIMIMTMIIIIMIIMKITITIGREFHEPGLRHLSAQLGRAFVVSANLRDTCWLFHREKLQSSQISTALRSNSPRHVQKKNTSKSWLAKFPIARPSKRKT